MNGRMGWRGAAEVHASAAAAATQRQVRRMLWVLTRPRCARSEPATRAASKTNGGNRYLYLHPQPAAPQQPCPQQLRTQARGSHCACAEAMNYESRSPPALISETPGYSIGSYPACCAWLLRRGWGFGC